MVNGAPAKPMSGAVAGSARRSSRIASSTNGVASRASGARSAATSAAERTGRARWGPGLNVTSTPIAGSGTRMSEKRIAASTPSLVTGCSVISQASSGVWQQVRKSARSRSARYSGR